VIVLLSATAALVGPYDRKWSVEQVCDSTAQGVRGYTGRYDVTVTDSHVSGHYRSTSCAHVQLTLEGTVKDDDTAQMTGKSVSGKSDFDIDFSPAGTAIHIRVAAKFAGTHGSGERLSSQPANDRRGRQGVSGTGFGDTSDDQAYQHSGATGTAHLQPPVDPLLRGGPWD
jgi:hypothetical protein